MQKLHFEATWDKTISDGDRALITQAFNKRFVQVDTLSCEIIRSARNHHGHLLVTVLLHNTTAFEQRFMAREVHLQTKHGQFTQKFTQSKLVIASGVSMPWTFIFEQMPPNAGDVLAIQIEKA